MIRLFAVAQCKGYLSEMKVCYVDETGIGDGPVVVNAVDVIVDAQRTHKQKDDLDELLVRLSKLTWGEILIQIEDLSPYIIRRKLRQKKRPRAVRWRVKKCLAM